MEFEAWAESRGFPLADCNDVQVASLRAAWRAAEQPPAPTSAGATPAPAAKGTDGATEVGADLDDLLARQRAETLRQRRIAQMTAEAAEEHPGRIDELEHIGRSAIKGKWTEQATELAILRTTRASAPAPLSTGERIGSGINERIIEAALAQSAGLSDLASHYDEKTLDLARRHYRGSLGLHQLLHLAAKQNGYRGEASVRSNLQEVMHFAFTPKASGISTISIPGVLSNIANKFVIEAFMGVDNAWSSISARRNVSDFKTITSYSLSGDMTYEEIPPGGSIKHGTIGETTYTNAAKSYGKMLGLDRRDLINDDLSALSAVSRRLGRGGALKLNKIFWGIFLNNSTFFTSGHANVSTGATTTLTLTGLGLADPIFRLLTDPDGNLMGVTPKKLVVPTALRAAALGLMNSTTVVSTTTANTPLPDQNIWAGMFDVVSSPYLQDSTLTGYSTAAWYLLSDPNDVPVIETCFLNGIEMPTIESADADFAQLGIQWRGYFDFGVSLMEYRGGVRSAGA